MASITEYPITIGTPNPGNSLFGITGGPDGNVYFTDTWNNAIGHITPSGGITELPLPSPVIGGSFSSNGLDGITLRSNNGLAFTESTQGAIGNITTSGSYNQYPIDSSGKVTNQGPDLITTTSDGTLWWTEDRADAIGELTPAGVVHEYPVPGATDSGFGSSLNGITAGSDGNIWFTNYGSLSSSFVGMITPSGKITEYPFASDADPWGIVNGPDGNLWITGSLVNTIYVMSTSGTILHQYAVPAGPGLGGETLLHDITVGSDKNLYFTEEIGNIGEITTSGAVTITPVSTTVHTAPGASGPQPDAITSGPDGNVWFTDPWTDSIGVLKIVTTPTSTPTPTPTPSPTPTPTPIPTPTPSPTHAPAPSPTRPAPLTPPPAARPLPLGFLRTPPKIVRVATRMVGRAPEIVLQLDQGVASKLAREKVWYRLERPRVERVLGMSDDPRLAVSRVVYQAKTHTITLVMPRRQKTRGNVMLSVDARGIVNLLGQELEGDDALPGVNLVREVDLP